MQDDEVNKNPVQDNTDMTQTTIEPSVVQPTAVANQAEIVPKKHTVLTVVLVIVAAVITLIAIIITIIIMVVFSLVADHTNELNTLKKETMSIFSESTVPTSSYWCRDVELRNMCSFETSVSSDEFKSYVLSKGFVESTAHGNGYKKGDLFLEIFGENNYGSLYL